MSIKFTTLRLVSSFVCIILICLRLEGPQKVRPVTVNVMETVHVGTITSWGKS